MRNFDLPGRSAVYADNGMAATSHPLATMTALSVLRSGGNAVDAAIAACATLCVVEPHMTGIGGDCFVILAEPDGSIHGLNGSGRAPMAADPEWFRAKGLNAMPEHGALPITVPGAIDAWEKLSNRFGTKGFDELFADAIRYGEEGYAVHGRVALDWPKAVDLLSKDAGGAKHYLVDGKAPPVGSRHSAPALAATFRAIAKNGSKAFYQGEIGAEIAATVKSLGGLLTEADLAAVSANWVDPIATRYGDYDVHEIPPNGQGITALILLRLMAKLDTGRLAPDSADRVHMEIEAARLAYSVRDHLVADPRTMTVTPEHLLSDAYIDALAARIDIARRNDDVAPPEMPSSDTVYLTVVDRDRRAVSFINSTYHGFGSKVVTPKSGITLQNRGAGFTLAAGHPNEIGPGKRPMHTIIPAMATRNGKAAISFGVMGGDYQPMGHAHVLSNIADHGMDPQEAIDDARIFWNDTGAVLNAETGIGPDIRADLERRGHKIQSAPAPHGGGQAVVIDEKSGFLIAGSDPRKDGCAMGW